MNKKPKKVFSCLLALALICQMASFVVIAEPATAEVIRLEEDFNEYADGTTADSIATADSGWTYMHEKDRIAIVQNKALYMAGYLQSDFQSGRVSFTTTEKFTDGYIQTDVKLDAPPNDTKTYYTGHILARCTTHLVSEIGTRFSVRRNASGKIIVALELLVRDPNANSGPYYGTVAGVADNSFVIPDFDVNKSYNVKLQTIGNSITVFLDGEQVISCALDATYGVTSRSGSFGVANLDRNCTGVTYDNVVAVSLETHSVSTAAGIETEKVRDLKTVTTMHNRISYAAGETVTLVATDAESASVPTVVTKSNAPVSVTEVMAGKKYSFVMPNEDVTVICEEIEESEELLRVEADFNGLADGTTADSIATADSGWTYINEKDRTAVVQNEAFYMSGYPQSDFQSGRVSLMTTEKFTDGYIQADVKFDAPPQDTKTYYTGSIAARCTTHLVSEVGMRFSVRRNAEDKIIVALELLVRDPNTNNGPYYGTVAGVSANSYIIPDFDVNKSYNVKLQTIGNSVAVFLDGVQVISCALDTSYDVASRSGSFGVANLDRNCIGVTYDNVVAVSLKTHSVSTAEGVETEKIRDLKTVTTMHSRNSYAAGETVNLVSTDTVLSASALSVVTESNAPVSITEVVAGQKYSFVMPNEDVTVIYDKDNVTEDNEELLRVEADFNGLANGTNAGNIATANSGWTYVHEKDNIAITQNEGLYMSGHPQSDNLGGSVSFMTTEKFADGYIQADVKLDAPTDTKNYYTGNIVARCTTHQVSEIGTRFSVRRGSDGKINVALELLVRDPNTNSGSYYGTVTGVSANNYIIPNFDINKSYNVKLQTVGNSIAVYLDGKLVIACALDETYSVASRSGSFGVANLARNSTGVTYDNVVAVSLKTHSVTATEGVEAEKIRDLKTVTTLHNRTSYAAGETVNLDITEAGVDVSTLRVVTESGKPVSITEVILEQRYSFVMPTGNVTVSCEKLSQSVGLPFFIDFNSYTAGVTGDRVLTAAKGWTSINGANASVTDSGKLNVPAAVTFLTKETAHNGYIQADIQLAEPAADGTYYAGNLYANYVAEAQQELRTRFAINKKADKCTIALQLVVYDVDLSGGTDGIHYAKSPMVTTYNVGELDPNAVYTVKFEVIGNYIQVSLNNRVVLSRTMNPDCQIVERAGTFGFGGHANAAASVSATFDNVQIDKYEAYGLTVDTAMQGYISLDEYLHQDINSNGTDRFTRNSFKVGEFVLLHLNVVDGMIADGNNLKYISASGNTAITAHETDTLYGFAMPAESVTVTSVVVEATIGTESDIYLVETFDEERLMIDNGWERDALIKNGALQLGDGTDFITLNLTNKLGASEWTDYSVEATIKVAEAKIKDQDMVAALCVRGGYEFGIYFAPGAKQGYFRLYDRVNGKLLVSSVGKAVAGESYTLKMEVRGTTLTGYVNGTKVFSITDDACSAGTIGFRTLRAQIECDDITVKKI